MSRKINRKEALKSLVTGVAFLSSGFTRAGTGKKRQADGDLKGKIKHSVCQWCYYDIPLEELCQAAAGIGLQSVELLGEEDWPVVFKHDLTCAMANGTKINLERGFNETVLHPKLKEDYFRAIPKAAEVGITKIICFSGNKNGLSDQQGLENCAIGLDPILKMASQHGITICMELLNSKLDHPDHQCDRTQWGVDLVEKIGSDHFKLLYDIYHMQIMEGDIIATIQKYHQYIAHYHTGGVPGRAEIDESQELNYPAIMKAILKTGFKGYVAQEFIPKGPDPLASLEQGVRICDVEI